MGSLQSLNKIMLLMLLAQYPADRKHSIKPAIAINNNIMGGIKYIKQIVINVMQDSKGAIRDYRRIWPGLEI